jgi:hypothetical protein
MPAAYSNLWEGCTDQELSCLKSYPVTSSCSWQVIPSHHLLYNLKQEAIHPVPALTEQCGAPANPNNPCPMANGPNT